jgi:hypothetical protein
MYVTVIDFFKVVKEMISEKGFENFYRGHSNKDFKLIPSIYRDGLVENEINIFKETILRTPHEFLNCKSTVEKLVKMQHYGVPTRLLDITSNPLIALYFACRSKKNENKDGKVVFFRIPNEHIKFYDSDTVSILANVSKLPNFEIDVTAKGKKEFNKTNSMQFLLHEIREEKPYFKEIVNRNDLEDVFAVKVKLDNPRILKQGGAFLIFGIDANKKRHAEVSHRWIREFIIPFGDKDKILNDLNLMGINQSTLFPEIESQGQHLIEKYKI